MFSTNEEKAKQSLKNKCLIQILAEKAALSRFSEASRFDKR
jgi:hypothetical protein